MFQFKQFSVDDSGCGMKVSSDSVLLGAWFLPQVCRCRSLIDVGAGSGLLSLMAAQVCAHASITAVEIDAPAAEMCRLNVEASPSGSRITTVQADFRTALLHPAEAIISNPPYFANGLTAPQASRAAARHQQSLTFEELFAGSARLLTPDGILGLIAPSEFEQRLIFGASMAGLNPKRIAYVSTSAHKPPKRILCTFGRSAGKAETQTISLDSEEYRQLVEPFYIRIH